MSIQPGGWSGPRSPSEFGTVVGTYDHEIQLNGAHSNPHARMALDVNGQPVEADINVHSMLNPDGTPGGSDVQYAVKDSVVDKMPAQGEVEGGHESYTQDGLTPGDFKTVTNEALHQQLIQLAEGSQEVSLTGQIYHDPGKTGIHDIHMNNGETDPGRDHPGEDGVASFYRNDNGQIHKESVYVKFQSQSLDAEQQEPDAALGQAS